MFRSIIITFFIIIVSVLCAEANFYPTTILAEEFGTTIVPACSDAYAGIDVLHNQYHNGEFISARYYVNSAGLSNADSEARFGFYDLEFYPEVIFSGTQIVSGSGTNIANGSLYLDAISSKKFAASPIKMNITNFNPTTGAVSARVTMRSNDYALNNQTIRFLLIENNVSLAATNVVRSVLSQPITLTGLDNFLNFSATFTVLPAWNINNLWAAAFVQLNDNTIIQSASTLVQPEYQIRAAMQFNPDIVDYPNINYTSPMVGFYNTGLADNYTIKLIKDSGPDDWYFNYCGGEECYPGNIPHPFSLAAGDTVNFHLNLLIGSAGTGSLHFIVESPNIEPYIIPFTYTATDTYNDDPYLPSADVRLLQNFPNPFAESTNLRIYAKQPVKIADIDIFNSKGQKVNTIPMNALKKGINEMSWNGFGNNKQKLPQGIYFYRVNGTGAKLSGKMLILNK